MGAIRGQGVGSDDRAVMRHARGSPTHNQDSDASSPLAAPPPLFFFVSWHGHAGQAISDKALVEKVQNVLQDIARSPATISRWGLTLPRLTLLPRE